MTFPNKKTFRPVHLRSRIDGAPFRPTDWMHTVLNWARNFFFWKILSWTFHWSCFCRVVSRSLLSAEMFYSYAVGAEKLVCMCARLFISFDFLFWISQQFGNLVSWLVNFLPHLFFCVFLVGKYIIWVEFSFEYESSTKFWNLVWECVSYCSKKRFLYLLSIEQHNVNSFAQFSNIC